MLNKLTDDSRAVAEMGEFDTVELTTDKYEKRGLKKGARGTIMDVLSNPRCAYTVEFHKMPYKNMSRVTTLEPDEVKMVKCLHYEYPANG